MLCCVRVRAHFRLLWVHGATPPRAVLWLETVNADFEARVDPRPWQQAVLIHAIAKAERMGVGLSVEPFLSGAVQQAAKAGGHAGSVGGVSDALVLRPSNGVVEASDYLTNKHDWVQQQEEVTRPLKRALYTPSSASGDAAREL